MNVDPGAASAGHFDGKSCSFNMFMLSMCKYSTSGNGGMKFMWGHCRIITVRSFGKNDR
ncbi:uncharacterized protein J3R85_001645 [Psidium guajava]|nr:uncharacterized protein J3R85_001645 [Psidium guajava]